MVDQEQEAMEDQALEEMAIMEDQEQEEMEDQD